jgi:dTDP-glucose 4,6-dehydratase
MKTILITGGAGFIGSNFVRFLHDRYPAYRLVVVDALTYAGDVDNLPPEFRDTTNQQYTFWYGNVRNADLMDTLVSQSDVVVHFAAETHVTRSIYDNLLFFETDVLGTQVVANSVLKHLDRIERFIHISSSEVYGSARTPRMEEGHPLMPMSPYAAAKAGADRLVYSYGETYGIPSVIVRPFNNYGPYQHLEKAIPRFVTSCILDEPLRVHGDGRAARDWLYVEDTCEGLDRILHAELERVKGEVFNLGYGMSHDVETIARMIIAKMGKPESLLTHIGDRPGQVFRHTASVEKAERLLGWRARVSLDDGLDRTIAWYRNNRLWWEKQLWMRSIPIVTTQGTRELH